jgi:hypothetical protein
MTYRRLLVGLLLASGVVACFGGRLVIASGPRVTAARFDLIQKGMSREEVERALGGPPGDYSTGPCLSLACHANSFCQTWTWLCDDGHLFVDFNESATARQVVAYGVIRQPRPTILERLQKWFSM